jgi:hypothetical protein
MNLEHDLDDLCEVSGPRRCGSVAKLSVLPCTNDLSNWRSGTELYTCP